MRGEIPSFIIKMRTIKINIDDKVFKKLERKKKELGLSWDKLIVNAVLQNEKNK